LGINITEVRRCKVKRAKFKEMKVLKLQELLHAIYSILSHFCLIRPLSAVNCDEERSPIVRQVA
jgi:hypothetical protein